MRSSPGGYTDVPPGSLGILHLATSHFHCVISVFSLQLSDISRAVHLKLKKMHPPDLCL